MKNKLSIVASATINADTENCYPAQTDNNIWYQNLNLTYNELTEKIILKIPDSVRQKITMVIMCSSADDAHARAKCVSSQRSRPRDVLSALGITSTGIINDLLPNVKNTFKVDAACASGLFAMELAKFYTKDVVLILGVDTSTSSNFLNLFSQLGALAQNTDQYYVPFDQRRSGFIMGEGAAAIVVADNLLITNLHLNSLATVDAIETTTIYNHPTSPSDPTKLELFIKKVLKNSKRSLSEFAYWDAHATATPMGDESEYQIFVNLFRQHNTKISSFKSRVGHCMSASSLVEIANAIAQLQLGKISHNFNLQTKDAIANDHRIITNSEKTHLKTFIKTSFGFGGRIGIAVITVH
jgi:3-oxoacyl-(acyl-carrier-protein) synthase